MKTILTATELSAMTQNALIEQGISVHIQAAINRAEARARMGYLDSDFECPKELGDSGILYIKQALKGLGYKVAYFEKGARFLNISWDLPSSPLQNAPAL